MPSNIKKSNKQKSIGQKCRVCNELCTDKKYWTTVDVANDKERELKIFIKWNTRLCLLLFTFFAFHIVRRVPNASTILVCTTSLSLSANGITDYTENCIHLFPIVGVVVVVAVFKWPNWNVSENPKIISILVRSYRSIINICHTQFTHKHSHSIICFDFLDCHGRSICSNITATNRI